MEKDEFERTIIEIEERLKKLEKENDVLKIELGNSIIEKYHLGEAKQRFIDIHIAQEAKLEEQIAEEVKQMQEYIKILKERCEDLEKENKFLLSERSGGMLKEVLKQAKTLKKKTGENPFENI